MQDFLKDLCNRTGLSQDQANQVISYLKQHRNELDQIIGGSAQGASAGVGNRNVGGQTGSSRT